MTQVKNPAEQNNPLETNDGSNQSYKNENDRSQEVDLPVPEKKNDDITTGNGKTTENTNKTGRIDKDETNDEQRKDKRGDEQENEDRDNPKDTKTKDAGWQQDKMNEADKQSGKSSNPTGKDTSDDSMNQGSISETNENTEDEKKDRQKMVSRQNTETSSNPSLKK